MSLKFANYKDHKIGYSVSGTGKTVILIPGFTESLEIFEFIQNHLSENYKVISIDMPGTFTSTSLFHAETDWTIDLLSTLILAVANHEGEEYFCLLGHSMGGYIALALTSHIPDRISGLGLIHSTAYEDSHERKEFRLKSIEFIEKDGSVIFLEQMVNGLYSDDFKNSHPEAVQKHLNSSKSIDKEVLISQYKAMMFRPDYKHTLKMFNKPVLFFAGEEDKSVPLKDTLKQSSLPPLSQISILENTGHMGFVEYPERSAQILRNYCQLVFSI